MFDLLFITVFDLNIDDIEQIGIFALMALIIAWFVIGGFTEVWVWGRHHREEVGDLKRRLSKTEQRLRIMEMLALRGTHLADRLAPEEDIDESN